MSFDQRLAVVPDTGLLSDQSAVRILNLDDVRLNFGDQAFGRLKQTQTDFFGWEAVPTAAVLPAPRRLD